MKKTPMKVLLAALLTIALSTTLHAQLTWSPQFATDQDSITITFDATQGNAALANFTGDVYAHTGVITNLSTSPTNWKYVKQPWGSTDPSVKATRISANIYQLKFHVRNYYGVPAAETVDSIAILFRDGPGNIVGRGAGGTDMYIPIAVAGQLGVAITAPATNGFVNIGTSVNITATSNQIANLAIFVNGVQVHSAAAATNISHILSAANFGKYKLKVVATTTGGASTTDSAWIMVRPPVTNAALPANAKQNGVTYLPGGTSAIVALHAPSKQYAYLIGDFNGWEPNPTEYMNYDAATSRYWIQLNNLVPQQEYAYQFMLDGNNTYADPYAHKILDPNNDPYIPATSYPNLKTYPSGRASGIVSVLQTNQPAYNWQVNNFVRPAKEKLVIYELLVRDFTASSSFQGVIDSLGYLKSLGINCIEFMPVMEFEGNDSWGYNPSFHLALDKYYGTPDKFKELVDKCHQNGIAVVLDIALNHAFGQNPMVQMYWDPTVTDPCNAASLGGPANNNPWLNPYARHPYNVGYDFNHESLATKQYLDDVNKYWLNEFKVDGFRFDLSKGFTQTQNCNVGAWGNYDQSRVNILTRMTDQIWANTPGAYVILEHLGDNSEETVLANYGMLLWSNLNYSFNESIMGYNGDQNWLSYKNRNWNAPNNIAYMESHDEERLIYKTQQFGSINGTYNTKDLATSTQRAAAAAAYYFCTPGPKMIWQFGELGYDITINQNGRTGRKPILWSYLSQYNRKNLRNTYAGLALLKKNYQVFSTSNFTVDYNGKGKIGVFNDAFMNAVVVSNLDVNPLMLNVNNMNNGKWYNYFKRDSITVTNGNWGFNLAPGDFAVYTTRRLPAPPFSISGVGTTDLQSIGFNVLITPNPATDNVQIVYEIPEALQITIEAYDIQGKKVATIAQVRQDAGKQTINWNATDDNGSRLPAGNYLMKMTADGMLQNLQKLVIIK
jgi:1,4-alpha-glucan branching enzyme